MPKMKKLQLTASVPDNMTGEEQLTMFVRLCTALYPESAVEQSDKHPGLWVISDALGNVVGAVRIE